MTHPLAVHLKDFLNTRFTTLALAYQMVLHKNALSTLRFGGELRLHDDSFSGSDPTERGR